MPPLWPLVPYTASGTSRNDDGLAHEGDPVFPYLAMLAVPSSLALTGARRAGFLLVLVGLFYWLMIGFRFQVGADCLLFRPDSTTS